MIKKLEGRQMLHISLIAKKVNELIIKVNDLDTKINETGGTK